MSRAAAQGPTASPAGDEEVVVVDERHVRTITINRPERSNALSRHVMSTLLRETLAAADDPDVRVVVYTGAGERAFCAGADLKEIAADDAAGRPYRSPVHGPERALFEVITETYKPTIAMLNGHAVAGGCELALSCDLRIAAEGVELGLPEAKRGMGAHFGCVYLPKSLPWALAMEMLFTGDRVSAEQAAAWGLLNKVVPRASLLAQTKELAGRIARNAPLSLQRMKEMGRKGYDLPLPVALRLDVGPDPYASEDRAEGIAAYLENRAPRWRGR